jgi:hypothetical protein
MDIPAAKDFNSDKPIDIETEVGIVQLFPLNAKHGEDSKRFRVAIDGIVFTKIESRTSGFITFGGKRFNGHFTKIVLDYEGCWKVVFETLISDPEFWKDVP